MNKKHPHKLEIPQLKTPIEVEEVKPPLRYHGEMTTGREPGLQANLGDTYYNTSLSKLRVKTSDGWRSAA